MFSTKEIRNYVVIQRLSTIRRDETRPLTRSRSAAKSFSAENRRKISSSVHTRTRTRTRTGTCQRVRAARFSQNSQDRNRSRTNTPRPVMTFPNQNTDDRNETQRIARYAPIHIVLCSRARARTHTDARERKIARVLREHRV